MGTTAQQDRDFIHEVVRDDLLESAIEWIRKNLDPQDVFEEHSLRIWARDNGMVDE